MKEIHRLHRSPPMTSTISGPPATERSEGAVVARASLSLAILSGWFVVTRLGLGTSCDLGRHRIAIWRGGRDVGADLAVRRIAVAAIRMSAGIPLAALWDAPFIFLVGAGSRLTSAALTSSIAPARIPMFAGIFVWKLRGHTRGVEIPGYVLISAGLVVLVRSRASTDGRVDPVGVLSLVVVAAAMWAFYTLRLRASELSPLQATALTRFGRRRSISLAACPICPARLPANCCSSRLTRGLMSVVAVLAFNRAVASLGPRAAAAIVALCRSR
jgi:hypothetical protein